MDKTTTLKQVRDKVKKMAHARKWHTSGRDSAVSISIEAAELLELFQWEDDAKKMLSGKMDSKKREQIEGEVADILVYLSDFANNLNIDLSNALDNKLQKIDEKYPTDRILRGGNKFYYSQKKKYRQSRNS